MIFWAFYSPFRLKKPPKGLNFEQFLTNTVTIEFSTLKLGYIHIFGFLFRFWIFLGLWGPFSPFWGAGGVSPNFHDGHRSYISSYPFDYHKSKEKPTYTLHGHGSLCSEMTQLIHHLLLLSFFSLGCYCNDHCEPTCLSPLLQAQLLHEWHFQ